MKIRHHPFDNNTLDENALLQIKIILAKTYRVVKPDLGRLSSFQPPTSRLIQ